MKLLECNLQRSIDCTGYIIFEMEDENGVSYVYYIGEIESPPGWFSRQLATDYYDKLNNWEVAEWHPEDNLPIKFKFLKK